MIRRAILAILAAGFAIGGPAGCGGRDTAPAPAPHPLTGQVPWDLPPLETLRAAPHKVFAHYFIPFPVSIDNKPPAEDYYERGYLAVDGENRKHAAYGGYLRERPLPRPPIADPDWPRRDLEHEVRLARDAGLDGFVVDLLGTDDRDGRVRRVCEAARAVDPGFAIVLMPDMTAGLKAHPERLVPMLLEMGRMPSVLRLPDGRLVVSPYCAQIQPPAWWQERMRELEQAGMPIALLPLFQGGDWASYAPFSIGFADWGARNPVDSRGIADTPARVHRQVGLWMQPVAPQDARPKDRFFFEAAGSLSFRMQWEGAIRGGADWVQVVTWNDYSESSEIAPSTGTGHGFYDLTAWYAAWFKTGAAPPVARDGLIAIHRVQRSDVRLRRQAAPWRNRGNEPTRDEIEVLAFLTAPGEVEIACGGERVRQPAAAGMTALRAPLRIGRPTIRLLRDGAATLILDSPWEVVAEADFQDVLYRTASTWRR